MTKKKSLLFTDRFCFAICMSVVMKISWAVKEGITKLCLALVRQGETFS